MRFILEYTKLKRDNVIVGVNQFRRRIEHKVLLDGVNGTVLRIHVTETAWLDYENGKIFEITQHFNYVSNHYFIY